MLFGVIESYAQDHRIERATEDAFAKGDINTEYLHPDDRLPQTHLDFPYQIIGG